jgi:hypothetical protein
MPTTDLLVLAVARQPGGLTLAGMTTERDPKTGLRWVRLVPEGDPLQLDALRYQDGAVVQLGDVIRVDLGAPRPMPPQVEDVAVDLGDLPLERVRRLGGERRAAFFAGHLDPAPREVLGERSRSLCLVHPDYYTVIIERDMDNGQLDTKFALAIASGQTNEDGTPKYLRSREDLVATDIYWRALMRTWLNDEEFLELDGAEVRERLGELYLVLGLSSRGKPRVLGVHTVPEFEVSLDEDDL